MAAAPRGKGFTTCTECRHQVVIDMGEAIKYFATKMMWSSLHGWKLTKAVSNVATGRESIALGIVTRAPRGTRKDGARASCLRDGGGVLRDTVSLGASLYIPEGEKEFCERATSSASHFRTRCPGARDLNNSFVVSELMGGAHGRNLC